MAGFDLPDIDIKSPWVLGPVAVGGLAGLFVLLRGGGGGNAPSAAPIPVSGQEPGGVGASSAFAAVAESLAALAEQVNQQDVEVSDQISTVTQSLAEMIGQAVGNQETARLELQQTLNQQLAAITNRLETPDVPDTVNSPEFQARQAVGEDAITGKAAEFNVPSWTMLAFLGSHLRLPKGYAEFQNFAAQEGWFNPQSGEWKFPEVHTAADIPVTWQRRFFAWWDKFKG